MKLEKPWRVPGGLNVLKTLLPYGKLTSLRQFVHKNPPIYLTCRGLSITPAHRYNTHRRTAIFLIETRVQLLGNSMELRPHKRQTNITSG